MFRLAVLAVVLAVAYCDLKADLQAKHDKLASSAPEDSPQRMTNFEETFAEDMKYINPEGSLIMGRDNLRKHFDEQVKKHGKMEFTAKVEHVIEQGDIVIDIGQWEMKVVAKPAEEARHRHKREAHTMKHQFMAYMAVWKKTGEDYHIIAEGTWLKK